MRPRRNAVPRVVYGLGAVSLLTDASSEMIVPLLPVFLSQIGGGALAVGVVEGVANAVASVLKLVAGRLADRLGRYRPFVVAGYGLAALTRPLLALAGSPAQVVALRAVDRVGKGLRSSPRDAIIAHSVAPHLRGRAFGLHRAMDHLGAAAGPLVAVGVLACLGGEVRDVFWAAAVPGAAAVVVLLWCVREPDRPAPAQAPAEGGAEVPDTPRARGPTGGLAAFLGPYVAYGLAHVTELFLLLRLGIEARLPVVGYPLAWVGLSLVKTAAAAAGGRLSDRLGRRPVLSGAWASMGVAFAVLASLEGIGWTYAALGLFAVQAGVADGVQRAWVADVVPGLRVGTGFGWFHFVEGALALISSLWFGYVWEMWGASTAFGAAAGLALLAASALAVLGGRGRKGRPLAPQDGRSAHPDAERA